MKARILRAWGIRHVRWAWGKYWVTYYLLEMKRDGSQAQDLIEYARAADRFLARIWDGQR